MDINWAQESCDRRDDPASGARIIQLTSAAAISNNIYGEQPYCSPDGKRIAIVRCTDFWFDDYGSLLVHELDTLRIAMAARNEVRGVRGVFCCAWSGLMYYWTPQRKLMQLSLMTLDRKEVYGEGDPQAPLIGGSLREHASVSPDQRYVIGTAKRLTGPGAPVFQIIRLDLRKGVREVIFEHPEFCTHLQFNPTDGRRILVQHNRGLRMEADGSFVLRHTEVGTTLFVIDENGQHQEYLPAGPPHTATCTGHECFVGATGRVLFSVGWEAKSDYEARHDPRWPQGNLFTAKPGDERPTPFPAPEHRFNHVSASRCGRYFVADSYTGRGLFENGEIKPVALVVGNLQTGKHRVLVQDSGASGGGNQATHTHPYLTADNRYVIYNADPHCSTPQVYAARLPAGFLGSLD